jgi:hypothetical protein
MDNLVKCTTDGCETLCVFKPRRYGLCDACFAEYRRRYNVNYQRTYQIQYRSKIAIQQLDAYREYQRARQQNMRDINKTVPPKLDGPRGYTVSYLQHLQVPVFVKVVNQILRREAWLA